MYSADLLCGGGANAQPGVCLLERISWGLWCECPSVCEGVSTIILYVLLPRYVSVLKCDEYLTVSQVDLQHAKSQVTLGPAKSC